MTGKALYKQRLARWRECNTQAYRLAGRDPLSVVHAHSTRCVAVVTALFSAVNLEDICTAVSWYTPVNAVLPLGHFGLFLGVCAHWSDTGLVKVKVVCVYSLYCT